MPHSDAIATLESVAADLGKLLKCWSSDQVSAAATPSDAGSDSPGVKSRPDLPTINHAVRTLWRLVAIQKSISQLKSGDEAPSRAHAEPAAQNLSVPRRSTAPRQSLPAVVPTVPCVPTVPSLISPKNIQAISAATKTLFAETAASAAAHGLPLDVPKPIDFPSAVPTDPVTGRPTIQGIGKMVESLRSEFSRLCQPQRHIPHSRLVSPP